MSFFIHLHRNGRTYGPYSEDSTKRFLDEGRVTPTDWAWTPGQDEWTPLKELFSEHHHPPADGSWLSQALEKIDANELRNDRLEIIEWACDQCGLKPLEVDARRMYVTDDSGERHLCSHPLEYVIVEKYLGSNISDQVLKERTGYYEDHFCTACFEISLLDSEKDRMVCAKCGKRGMKRGIKLANQNCPKCKKGVFTGRPIDMSFIDEIINSN